MANTFTISCETCTLMFTRPTAEEAVQARDAHVMSKHVSNDDDDDDDD